MKGLYIAIVVAAVLAARLFLYRRRKRLRAGTGTNTDPGSEALAENVNARPKRRPGRLASVALGLLGDVGLIAGREIRERVRGRIFRIGTLVALLAVAAAIVIPTLNKGNSGGLTSQRVGVVSGLSVRANQALKTAAASNGDAVTLEMEPSLASAEAELRAGRLDLVVVGGDEILTAQPAASKNSPADPGLVSEFAEYLGVLRAYHTARLTPVQAALVSHAKPVPVRALAPGSSGGTKPSSVIGIVLLFLMLTQYDTWILIGVMQEKSSRVVEVLLAAVRPLQLLGGKVLGIGLVALAQATLIVGVALGVAAAVGSDLLRGSGPWAIASELLWLVLGYAFYSWVYAAAGSTAERQDQVQTLALPLSIPIIVAYVYSITVVSSGDVSPLFKVLAFLPPTAPFCMSALVALGEATWWEFLLSALLMVAATIAMAIFAANVYRRAVLRTGGRVRLRELAGRPAR